MRGSVEHLRRLETRAYPCAGPLVPAQSKKSRAIQVSMAAVSCGLGEGAESGAGLLDHRAS